MASVLFSLLLNVTPLAKQIANTTVKQHASNYKIICSIIKIGWVKWLLVVACAERLLVAAWVEWFPVVACGCLG